MTVQSAFNEFYKGILLDDKRERRMNTAVDRLKEYCRSNLRLSLSVTTTYLQGSVANRTNTRPINQNDEFDVDIIVGFNFSEKKPSEAFDLLETELKRDRDYASRLDTSKKRCVRLHYANEFHLDLVPAHSPISTADIIQIPVRENGWEKSNPKAFTRWCADNNARTANDFSRVVRMMKWWRRNESHNRGEISSILLTVLLAKAIPPSAGAVSGYADESLIYKAFLNLHDFVRQNPTKPRVANPVLPEEDLAAGWPQSSYTNFKGLVSDGFDKATRALQQKSLLLWRDLFGVSFPVS